MIFIKLNYENEILYVPLWYSELIYDISNGSLIIKCIPDLSNNITINNNNIHIKIYEDINDILIKIYYQLILSH